MHLRVYWFIALYPGTCKLESSPEAFPEKKTSQNPAPRAQYLETPIVFCWWWEKTHFIHPKIQCHLLAPLAQKEFQAKLWPRLEASDLLKAHQTSLATQISS